MNYFSNIKAVARNLPRNSTYNAKQFLAYGKSCVYPGKVQNQQCSFDAFKASWSCVPNKVDETQPITADVHVDQLKSLSFLDKAPVLHNCKIELSSYLAVATLQHPQTP